MGTQLPGSSAEDGRSPVLTFRGVSRPAALRSWGSWSPPRMGLLAEVLPLSHLTLAKASAVPFCPERSDLGPAGIPQSVLTCASRQGPPTPLRSRQETDTVVEASELPTRRPCTTHPCSEAVYGTPDALCPWDPEDNGEVSPPPVGGSQQGQAPAAHSRLRDAHSMSSSFSHFLSSTTSPRITSQRKPLEPKFLLQATKPSSQRPECSRSMAVWGSGRVTKTAVPSNGLCPTDSAVGWGLSLGQRTGKQSSLLGPQSFSLPLTSLDFPSLVRPHYLQRNGRAGGCNCFLRVRSISGNSDPWAGCSLRLQVAIFHLCFKF